MLQAGRDTLHVSSQLSPLWCLGIEDNLFIFPGSQMALIRMCSKLSSDKLTVLPKMCSISTSYPWGNFCQWLYQTQAQDQNYFLAQCCTYVSKLSLRCIVSTCLLSLVIWIFLQLNKKVLERNSRTKCNKIQGRAASPSLVHVFLGDWLSIFWGGAINRDSFSFFNSIPKPWNNTVTTTILLPWGSLGLKFI